MIPAFGFSVGDFIGAIGLIATVCKAVKDKCGAGTEFQHVQLELQALDRTLRHLQALEPTQSNLNHVNAIRGMALTCQIPLQEFLQKIHIYERSLGSFPILNRGSLKSFGRKSQWAVFMSDEVAKLRTAIGAKVLSINLILATHTSEALSRLEAQAHMSHVTLLASILEQRSLLVETKDAIITNTRQQVDGTNSLSEKFDESAKTLKGIASITESINTTVISFRNLGIQLLQTINNLPVHVRNVLEQLVRSNMQMYELLREIHGSILRSPMYQPGDTFRFEDVLGRSVTLPYEHFRHLKIFNAFLETHFRGVPGEENVLSGQYFILDAKLNTNPIREDEWAFTVFPGSNLIMSVVIDQLASGKDSTEGCCPKSACRGVGNASASQIGFKICNQCGLKFSTALKNFARPPQSIPTAQSRTREESSWSDSEEEEDSDVPVGIQIDLAKREVERSDEDEFWIQGLMRSGTTEQTRHEMNVFRRVHLESRGNFFMNTGSISKFPFDSHHTQRVRDTFPHADEYLVERIGKAMSRRHHYLNYRKLRHEGLTGKTDANSSNWLSHTENLNPQMSLPMAYEDDWDETQAPTSTIGSLVGLPIPQGVHTGRNFRCLLCYRIIYCDNSRAWRHHAHRDLRPFVCTFKECHSPQCAYVTSAAWFQHEKQYHNDNMQTAPTECVLCKKKCWGGVREHLLELAYMSLPPSFQNSVYFDVRTWGDDQIIAFYAEHDSDEDSYFSSSD